MTTTESPLGRPRRILAVHRYFWPDTAPYGVILRSIVLRWAQDGHQVEVLSTQPSYRTGADLPRRDSIEYEGGVRVRRVALLREKGRGASIRLLNALIWVFTIFFYAIRRRRFDVIMVGTTPPVIAAAFARYAARITGARLIYHCMDIHPEIGSISGEFSNPILFGLLRRVDSRNCRGANHVVVLSDDMRAAIHERPGTEHAPVLVINNFNVTNGQAPPAEQPSVFAKRSSRLRVIFTGNIGRFQGLETVIDALTLLDGRSDWEMVFVGDGTALEELRARAGGRVGESIHFVPHQPVGVVRTMIRESDICLVSLAPCISQYAYPSKTMTYLGEGRPLLVCVEPTSDLAKLVCKEQIGMAVPPADPRALARAIGSLAEDRDRCADLGRRAAEIGPRLFDESKTLDEWSRLIASL